MADTDTLAETFERLAAGDAVTGLVHDPADESWTADLAPDARVTAALDTRTGLVTFAIALPRPDPGAAADLHEHLLRFAYLWRETGGLTAALDDTGAPVLMFRCAAAGLDAPALAGVLAALAAQRRAWAALIRNRTAGTPDPRLAMPLGGIRV